MGQRTRWLPFSSYSLMSEFTPAVGQEYWHCDMKRGFKRVRKHELQVKALLSQDTTVQRIGLLAQQGVYEFHQDEKLFDDLAGPSKVASRLNLETEDPRVQERVKQILDNYWDEPILRGKQIIMLSRGDEGFPTPIEIKASQLLFNLFAAIDCLFLEDDGTLHILDLKTGRSDFDLRQGYVYLLASQYLYPKQKAVASFYNLESCQWSESITATSLQLNAVRANLARIAQKHELQRTQYRRQTTTFENIFPPSPDKGRCKHCQFHSICNFSVWEVSA